LGWLKSVGKRTALAFLPHLVHSDDAFAASHLPSAEYQLYMRMDVRDRHHACLVAKALLHEHPEASSALLRAALLHDVGKSSAAYSGLERIAVHLYMPKSLPLEPRLPGLRGAWQRHLHHDAYGAELIRQGGGDARVAELVGRHHRPGEDIEARLLKEIDERF
jgi:putative nucleotidyltransferase with HDIG domain